MAVLYQAAMQIHIRRWKGTLGQPFCGYNCRSCSVWMCSWVLGARNEVDEGKSMSCSCSLSGLAQIRKHLLPCCTTTAVCASWKPPKTILSWLILFRTFFNWAPPLDPAWHCWDCPGHNLVHCPYAELQMRHWNSLFNTFLISFLVHNQCLGNQTNPENIWLPYHLFIAMSSYKVLVNSYHEIILSYFHPLLWYQLSIWF